MSTRALGRQFVSHEELAEMKAADFGDTLMSGARAAMEEAWETGNPEPQDNEVKHGGVGKYLNYLHRSIAKHGIQEPLRVSNSLGVYDGQHRGVVALEMKLPRIPIEVVR